MNKHFDEITKEEIDKIATAQEKEQEELNSFEISDEIANAFQNAMDYE